MMVTCPCCDGNKRLDVIDLETGQTLSMICCHCQGEGEVADHAPVYAPNDFAITVPAGLQRYQLSRDQKREHLRSAYKHMTDDEISRLLDKIYEAP